MKIVTGKEMANILVKNGWELKRIKGSHHIYIMEGKVERISLPIHGNQTLKIGLQKHIMKIADINEEEL